MRTDQLRALGLSASAISKRVARGVLHRRYRGIYAVGHPLLSEAGEWLAAVFACGGGAALTGVAVGRLHRVTRERCELIDVVVGRRRRGPPGVRVRQTRRLDPCDVTIVRGIPAVTIPRMLLDLTDEKDAFELARLIHEAAFRGLLSRPAVRAAIARARGRHNVTVLEHALWLYESGSAGTRSAAERRFQRLIGAPEPLVNTTVCGFEVDYLWPAHKLIVEVDGPGHLRPPTRREDAERDRILSAAGYTVMRVGDEDLKQRPQAVHATVHSALAALSRAP